MICTDFKRKIVGNIEEGCYFKCDAPLKKKTFIIDFYSFIVSSFVQFHECRPNVMACTTKIFQIIGVIFGLVFHELQWQVTRNPDVDLLFFFYIVPPLPTAKCRQNRTLIELTRPLMNTESKYPNIKLSNETTWYQNAFSRIILWPAPASFTCL